MAMNEAAFRKWYKNKNVSYPSSRKATERERLAKLELKAKIAKKDAEIARKDAALLKAKVDAKEIRRLREKLNDRKPTMALKNPVESIAASVEKIVGAPPAEVVDIEPMVKTHSGLMNKLIGEVKKIASVPPVKAVDIQPMIKAQSGLVDKLATVAKGMKGDDTQLQNALNEQIVVNAKILDQLKRIGSSPWQEVDFSVIRKSGLIDHVTVKRVR